MNLFWHSMLFSSLAIANGQQPESPYPEFLPKEVVSVEGASPHKSFGSISMAEGSPWCKGKPTYWLVGHENNEAPWCYKKGKWVQPRANLMEENIDRHNCETLDVNRDGVPDIICGVGAVSGTGFGNNEVYITNKKNGSLKLAKNHSLDMYDTMRNRFIKKLHGADGSDLVFLATKGVRRQDGMPNNHRMFRLTYPTADAFQFEEVGSLQRERPWALHTEASCLQVADVNNDGLDDIVLCNRKARGMMFVQKPDASWERVLFDTTLAYDWRNVRIADITGDGLNDLIVVGHGGLHRKRPKSYIRIFKGIPEAPYFDLSSKGLFYGRSLPYASPDLELLDVNQDGEYDIYVVQTDQLSEYCSPNFKKAGWWTKNYVKFVPPKDLAPDLLLVRTPDLLREFLPVEMTHSEPGCGHFVETFGDNRTMILSQGFRDRPGSSLLVKW